MDNLIGAMSAPDFRLTTQKSFHVEISRARDRAELVTDDAKALREQLEAVTGERLTALESIESTPETEQVRDPAAVPEPSGSADRGGERASGPAPDIVRKWTGPDNLELRRLRRSGFGSVTLHWAYQPYR